LKSVSGIGVIDLTAANEIENLIPFLQNHAQQLTCEQAYSEYCFDVLKLYSGSDLDLLQVSLS
jgi:hypothetical protein